MPVTHPATSGTGAAAGIWAPLVTLDGVDVSNRVVGEIRVDAEEGAARIAELALRPADSSPFQVADWVGKSLSIAIADMASGSPADVSALFAGVVDTPRLDFAARVVRLLASDDLQGIVAALDEASIDALVPTAYYSDAIFDPAAGGWLRLQDRLSTVPQALDLDVSGTPRLTDWAPKATPDLAFTEGHILDGSLSVSHVARHELVNHIDITFDYRFPRVKADGWPISYHGYVTNISDHTLAGNYLLTRDAVERAIHAAGGSIESITWEPLPNAPVGTWVPGPDDNLLCLGFDAVVSFDYAQSIEENHAITVEAPESVAVVGTLRERMAGALEAAYAPVVAAETAILLYKNEISGLPPKDTATPVSGYTTAAEVTLPADCDRAAADLAAQTLIAVAKARIWGSHRRNTAGAAVALNPSIDLDKTISLSATGVAATGKCRRFSHLLLPETGRATTEFSLAICAIAGTGVTHPEDPTTAPASSSPASTALVGTATADFHYLLEDDHEIVVTFPGVEDAERQNAQIPLASAYDATLTEDPLTVTL